MIKPQRNNLVVQLINSNEDLKTVRIITMGPEVNEDEDTVLKDGDYVVIDAYAGNQIPGHQDEGVLLIDRYDIEAILSE